MSVQEFRNNPIDRRRLSEPSRTQYSPRNRMDAISRAKSYRARNNYMTNRPKSTTVHKPGSGGQSLGRYTQGIRQADKSFENARSAEIASPNAFKTENDNFMGEDVLERRADRTPVGATTQKIRW